MVRASTEIYHTYTFFIKINWKVDQNIKYNIYNKIQYIDNKMAWFYCKRDRKLFMII